MLKKVILFTSMAIFLCSCVTGPRGYFKRSANNSLFDMFGFHGSKRQPLYNPKHIKHAKKNVARGEIDYDELDEYDEEGENIQRDNISIYKAMVEEDYANEEMYRKRHGHHHRSYPSIRKANHRVRQQDNHDSIRSELNQLKQMLNKTNEELASKKCPTSGDMERDYENKRVTPVTLEPMRSL